MTVLVALGLLGCDGDGDVAPCLTPLPETGSDTGDTAVGPCLDMQEEASLRAPALSLESPERAGAASQVLERGVLPADVASILSKRNK